MGLLRGNVYLLLDGGTAATKGDRPVVVVSRNELNGGNDVTVVPFTSQPSKHRDQQMFRIPFYEGEGGLTCNCFAKTDAVGKIPIAVINIKRGSIGQISDSRMNEILEGIKWSLKSN